MIAPSLLLILAAAPAADTFEQAKEAFRAGVTALDGGQPAEAVKHFRKSLSLRESPVAWFNLGMSCRQIKDHVCVVTALEKYLGSEGAQNTPELAEALANSSKEVARVAINVTGAFDEISVDGNSACKSLPCEVVLVPGSHQVAVRRPMPMTPLEKAIVVAAADKTSITLAEATPLPPPVASAPPPPPAVTPAVTKTETDVEGEGGPPWWVWAGAGAVVLGAVIAGVVVATRPSPDGGSLGVVLELEKM